MDAWLDVARKTDAMAAACHLTSASVFLSEVECSEPQLTYLYHIGVAEETQHVYENYGIFRRDPFVLFGGPAADGGGGSFFAWEDTIIQDGMDRVCEYAQFLNHHSVNVVGAWVQPLATNLYLVVGMHRDPVFHSGNRVSRCLLEDEAARVAGLAVNYLCREVLEGPQGKNLLREVRRKNAGGGPTTQCGTLDRQSVTISCRETQIIQLICKGRRNKEIAYFTGLSECTIENHLRRIYHKFGIHNRAALVARYSALMQ